MSFVALVLTGGAVAWSGMLVLAEEAPTVPRAERARTHAPSKWAVGRALGVARLALTVFAAFGAATAVEWWARPTVEMIATLIIAIAVVFALADGIPRATGALFPGLASLTVPLARRSLVVFQPLLGVLATIESRVRSNLPHVAPPSIGAEEGDLLAGVLSLRETSVADVMTPRLDMVSIHATASWHDAIDVVQRGEHARVPVFEGDVDSIIGILYAKDVAPAVAGVEDPPRRWQSLLRPPLFVPESKPCAAQLRDFQRGAGHLAIVVDEFGGTSGLIALEDILEEVVGEIRGEYDADEEAPIRREGSDKFWVDGTVTLEALSEALETPFEREEANTVGGLVYSELGRVPRPGEELAVGDFRVVVEKVIQRRIIRVYFEREREEFTIEPGGGEV